MKRLPKLLLVLLACLGCVVVSGVLRIVGGPSSDTRPTSQSAGISTATSEAALLPTGHKVAVSPTPVGYISATMLGDKWPLTITDGVLGCVEPSLVTLRSGNTVYAVNGSAKGWAKTNGGWVPLDTVIKPDPKIQGLIMSTQPLVDAGLALCGKS